MKTVQVRNITLGEGRPKICVPIVGQTKDDILLEAETFARIPVDVVNGVLTGLRTFLTQTRFWMWQKISRPF